MFTLTNVGEAVSVRFVAGSNPLTRYFLQELSTSLGSSAYLSTCLIHSKSKQIGGDLLLSTEKLAEKVRISGRQNFAINVRLS